MRILIATVTAGAGHVQAAAALEEAWRALRPRDTLQRLDALDFTPRLYRKVYVEGYVKLVEHAPELWGAVFKKTDNPALVRKLTRFRRTMAQLTLKKFVMQLKRFRPDVVLCTHYLPLEILGRFKSKSKYNYNALTVSVVTDFEAHALWMEPKVDLYCVAAEETKARLVARGAAPENVVVTGIPIGARFSSQIAPLAVRKRLGLRDDLPMLLVLGGGFGMGPVAQIMSQLNKLERAVQVVVVCGRNEDLRRELAVQDRRHPTHVFGFVSNMQELMAVADLVITKPGGLTSSEALAMGKPLFVLNPIPGQEVANSDFLLEHGAAAKANRLEDLPYRLEKLLGSPKLAEMAGAARALGKPQAATDICREVLRRIDLFKNHKSKMSVPRSHEWIDQRSLALDRLIADKLTAQPALLERAMQTLERWIAERQPYPPVVLLEWRQILHERPLSEILGLLRSDSQEARRLRQSSPFCGILSADERLAIFREYEAART
jgi:processive 1,2-diacylglycerol beta-glucosyltransferase